MNKNAKRVNSDTMMHHVGLKGHNSKCIFREDEDRQLFVDAITSGCEKYDVDLLVYALMDNHVHLILRGEIENFKYVFMSLGVNFCRRINEKYGDKGSLWEERYNSVGIASAEQFVRAAAYIFNNPVSAGMVDDPADYAWSNFNALRSGTFCAESTKIIDEVANVAYLIKYTFNAAHQKIAAREARALELISGRRLLDGGLTEELRTKFGDAIWNTISHETERRRSVIGNLWELGAGVCQISRVTHISRHIIGQDLDTITVSV